MKRYDDWLKHPNLDVALKEEMLKMNEVQIEDAFYTNIEFGTAGMRGILGAGTNRINVHTIRKANQGFAQYIIDQGQEAMERGVAIGYDNRHQSYEFAMDSARLLAKNNIKTYVYDTLRSTPQLSYAVRYHHCFGGIMITASHNPKEYNGYKLYDEQGCQLIPALANQVISHVNAIEDELTLDVNLTDEQASLINIISKEVDEAYYQEVIKIQLNEDLDKSNLEIIFSPEHGTANVPVQEIYRRLGYKCIPVIEQCSPDPDFSNTTTPNPEEKEAYTMAIAYAKNNNSDLILVCDPDADRMGVGVLHQKEYVLLTGNQSGAVLIEYILSQLSNKGLMPANPVMFNTVVTGDLGEKIAAKYGVETEKTLTGFKFIGEKVEKYSQTKEKNYVFGYEESYGSLIAPFVRDKDAPQACLMLAEAACYYKAQGKTLVDVLEDCYKEHSTYVETQFSVTLAGKEGALRIQEIMQSLRSEGLDAIADVKVIKIEDYLTETITADSQTTSLTGFTKADVLKYYLEDGSWVAIRPSGTEPKCKVYFCVCGQNKDLVEQKTTMFHNYMKKKVA